MPVKVRIKLHRICILITHSQVTFRDVLQKYKI
jgi:hypothetical protein